MCLLDLIITTNSSATHHFSAIHDQFQTLVLTFIVDSYHRVVAFDSRAHFLLFATTLTAPCHSDIRTRSRYDCFLSTSSSRKEDIALLSAAMPLILPPLPPQPRRHESPPKPLAAPSTTLQDELWHPSHIKRTENGPHVASIGSTVAPQSPGPVQEQSASKRKSDGILAESAIKPPAKRRMTGKPLASPYLRAIENPLPPGLGFPTAKLPRAVPRKPRSKKLAPSSTTPKTGAKGDMNVDVHKQKKSNEPPSTSYNYQSVQYPWTAKQQVGHFSPSISELSLTTISQPINAPGYHINQKGSLAYSPKPVHPSSANAAQYSRPNQTMSQAPANLPQANQQYQEPVLQNRRRPTPRALSLASVSKASPGIRAYADYVKEPSEQRSRGGAVTGAPPGCYTVREPPSNMCPNFVLTYILPASWLWRYRQREANAGA